MHIPDGPEALTTQWLTDALRKGGALQRARVKSFEWQPLGEGVGVTGSLVRLSLAFDLAESGAPDTLVCKFHSSTPETRSMAEYFGLYQREVCFYRDVAAGIGLPTPRCYYGDWAEGGRCVVLLEDMAPAESGGWHRDDLVERAEIAIRAIARLHAAWWEHPRLAELDWPLGADRSLFVQFMQTMQAESADKWDLFLDWMGGALPPAMFDIGQRLARCWGEENFRFFSESPRTLIHLDYHWDNLCFGGPQGGTPFSILDWQEVAIGRGVYDVAYLMASVPAQERRDSEMRILGIYHDLLLELGVKGYSFQQCLNDYRFCMLLYFGRLIAATMMLGEENLPRFRDLMLPRVMAAVQDLNAVELLPA